MDQINGIDWFNDFANVLVSQQNPDGSWPPCYGSNILGTEWALLTLQKAVLLPPAHDIAVASVTPSTNFVYRPNSLTISVVVNNLGEYAETFKVAVFYGDFPTNAQWNTFWSNVRGDINKDGYVNQADADILASNFGKHGPPGTIPGDLNNDGWVDIFDAIILTHDFGKNIWSYFHIQGGVIATQIVSNLLPGDSRTLVFTWNTAGYASGDYIIGAYAWLVAGETNEANNKIVDGVVTIKIHYRLTVNTDPLGLVPAPSVDPPSPDGFYDAGTLVTLTANAASGYTFKDWEVNPPVAPQAQADKVGITMDQDYTATAVYTFDLNIDTGFKAGDSLPYASDPYLDDILCVLTTAKGGYWLAGTSPGTFDYAITINNIGTTTFTSISLNINGHNDFCLDSQNPIRVVDASGSDTAQFEISGTWPTITISSKSTFTGLPASGSLYVTVHLDYALKGHIFSSSTYSKGYTFTATVSGTSGANQGDKDASGSVALLSKKVTVIFGFVTTRVGAVEGAEVDLYKGTQLLYSGYTDADGFYCFVDGVDGVGLTGGVTYKVSIAEFPTYTQTVTAVSKTAVPVNFKIPYYLDERLLERSL
jgi:hypothetical protein